MYVCIITDGNIDAGEVLIIKQDAGGLGAYLIGGKKAGAIAGVQPEGCVNFWDIAAKIGFNRIIAKAAVKIGRTVIAETDSKLLLPQTAKHYYKEGYGIIETAVI